MSADEIRKLVRIYSAKEKNLKCELEKFNDAEMTPNIENISIARNDAIMTIHALLAYAAMVERATAKRGEYNVNYGRVDYQFDTAMVDEIDYILTGKEAE